MNKLFVHATILFLVSYISSAQDVSGILTADPSTQVKAAEIKIDWTKCETEINKYCAHIVAKEIAEKDKASEREKTDNGFKKIEVSDEAKVDSALNTFTDKLKKTQPPQIDVAKHDCLSKILITDFSRECLTQFRSHCAKFNKTCGRRKKIKKRG